MKFEIKVGEEFDVHEESVEHTTVLPDGTRVEKRTRTRRSKVGGGLTVKKMLLWLAIVAIVSFFASSLVYGKLTGDYSMLKDFVQSTKSTLSRVVDTAVKQK